MQLSARDLTLESFRTGRTLLPVIHGPVCSDVYTIAGRAKEIKKNSSAGLPGFAAYAHQEIVPVFMTETCASPEVDKEVQEACINLRVWRFKRNGTALRRVC